MLSLTIANNAVYSAMDFYDTNPEVDCMFIAMCQYLLGTTPKESNHSQKIFYRHVNPLDSIQNH